MSRRRLGRLHHRLRSNRRNEWARLS
jgi:hypothetical protein